jgi:hypothetical protein
MKRRRWSLKVLTYELDKPIPIRQTWIVVHEVTS